MRLRPAPGAGRRHPALTLQSRRSLTPTSDASDSEAPKSEHLSQQTNLATTHEPRQRPPQTKSPANVSLPRSSPFAAEVTNILSSAGPANAMLVICGAGNRISRSSFASGDQRLIREPPQWAIQTKPSASVVIPSGDPMSPRELQPLFLIAELTVRRQIESIDRLHTGIRVIHELLLRAERRTVGNLVALIDTHARSYPVASNTATRWSRRWQHPSSPPKCDRPDPPSHRSTDCLDTAAPDRR